MMAMYDAFNAARDRGDFSVLPELHAVSSGLKALSTDITAAGIETARRQCGGHGYMLASGLPTLFNSYVQNCTWEGDNSGARALGQRGRGVWLAAEGRCNSRPQLVPSSALLPLACLPRAPGAPPPVPTLPVPPPSLPAVMYLQTARYLVKSVLAVQAGKPLAGSAKYLAAAAQQAGAKCGVGGAEDWRSPAHQLQALAAVAAQLAAQATQVLVRAGGGRVSFEGEAWNGSTVDLIRAARVSRRGWLQGLDMGWGRVGL